MESSSRSLMVLLVVLLGGCDAGVLSDLAPSNAARIGALNADESVLVDAVDGPARGLPAELRGRVEPVPPNSDASRVVVLEDGVPGLGVAPGARMLDAKIVDDGVLILGADHVLRHHTASAVRELDRNVYAPVSVAAGRVAYVAGGVPDMTLRWVDLVDGPPEALAPEILPAWSPALSADGEEVVFVATVRGRPQLLHRDRAGTIHEVAWAGRVPSAPVAPQWRGRYLVFGDEAGVLVLDLEEGRVQADYVGATLLPDRRSGASWVELNGEVERIDLPEVSQ